MSLLADARCEQFIHRIIRSFTVESLHLRPIDALIGIYRMLLQLEKPKSTQGGATTTSNL